MKYNPYYSPEKLGLESISFDEPGMGYEYNTALFVKTPSGEVYMTCDSGYSCPTPFEAHEAETMQEAIQGMERMGNFEDAWQQLRSWGKRYDGTRFVDEADREELRRFMEGTK